MPKPINAAEMLAFIEASIDRQALLRLTYDVRDHGACDRDELDPLLDRLADCSDPLPSLALDFCKGVEPESNGTFSDVARILRRLDPPHADHPPSKPTPEDIDKRTSSSHWFRLCEMIKTRDGHLCRCCGSGAEAGRLIVHCRWHPDRIGAERLEDLITICPRCSAAIAFAKRGVVAGIAVSAPERATHP